ncbi:MAG: CD225/dispanin family protein [Actinomycetota bacterium]
MSDYGSTPPPPPPPPPMPYGGYGVQGAPPPNYLVWAILSTILCFLPLGIVAIVFSAQVNSKWAMGDVAGAQKASGLAKKLTIWTVVLGVVLFALAGILAVAGVLLTTTTDVSVN